MGSTLFKRSFFWLALAFFVSLGGLSCEESPEVDTEEEEGSTDGFVPADYWAGSCIDMQHEDFVGLCWEFTGAMYSEDLEATEQQCTDELLGTFVSAPCDNSTATYKCTLFPDEIIEIVLYMFPPEFTTTKGEELCKHMLEYLEGY